MALDRSLSAELIDRVVRRVALPPPAEVVRARPVHVLYGGAHLFTKETPAKIGARAWSAMESWGADDAAFGRAIGLGDASLATLVAARVRDKLAKRPVEAMCIDFEDGYGPRSDGEEDAEAIRTAAELASTPVGPSESSPAPIIGIRIKALAGATARRGLRTLDLFLTTFARASGAGPRAGFTVTLPKVTRTEEVGALADVLDHLEAALGLPRIGVELMLESPRALVGPSGVLALPALVDAARQRVVAVHLGAYDLTAELGVTAGDQRLDHPFCDLARKLAQLALAGAPIGVSDGATTILPIPPKDGSAEERAAAVHRAWSLHASNVRRAIDVGIWQGWDLHPAQLPARYGALFAYFLERKAALALRLRSFVEEATRASRVGQTFDDAATGQGLLVFFLRGLACGALDREDLRATTLTPSELEGRSFTTIVDARTKPAHG